MFLTREITRPSRRSWQTCQPSPFSSTATRTPTLEPGPGRASPKTTDGALQLMSIACGANGVATARHVRIARLINPLRDRVASTHTRSPGRWKQQLASQYSVLDMRNSANYSKPGFHRDTAWLGLLQSNRNLVMEGRLYDGDGGLYYAEKLTDLKFNPRGDVRMMSTAYCGPDPGSAIWARVDRSTWDRPPQPAPPAAVALAPPPPVQPLQVPSASSSAGDSVPILV